MNKSDIVKQQSDFILYTGNDGKVELEIDSTVRKFRTVQEEGTKLEEKSVISILETTASVDLRQVKYVQK